MSARGHDRRSGSPDDWARRRLAEALLEMSRMQAERSDMREV